MGLKRLYLNISTYSYSYTVTISKKEKKRGHEFKEEWRKLYGRKDGEKYNYSLTS